MVPNILYSQVIGKQRRASASYDCDVYNCSWNVELVGMFAPVAFSGTRNAHNGPEKGWTRCICHTCLVDICTCTHSLTLIAAGQNVLENWNTNAKPRSKVEEPRTPGMIEKSSWSTCNLALQDVLCCSTNVQAKKHPRKAFVVWNKWIFTCFESIDEVFFGSQLTPGFVNLGLLQPCAHKGKLPYKERFESTKAGTICSLYGRMCYIEENIGKNVFTAWHHSFVTA